MKLFYAMLGTETNTFSPMPTGLNVWRSTILVRSKETEGPMVRQLRQSLRPFLDRVAARGWEIEVGQQALAAPAGITPRPVYEGLRDELIRDLRAALPVDGVVLFLHGAMIAEGYDDCEGDVLARVRAVVGPDVPLGAELDLHCHLTEDMLRHATALVGYKEYPHVDMIDRLVELFEIVADTAEGNVRPTMARFDCRMIGLFPTTSDPMKTVVQEMKELERRSGVLNVWLSHGFPYADLPTIGTQAIAITDGDPVQAAQVAERLGRRVFSLCKSLRPSFLPIDQSLTRALQAERGPVTIADSGDNPGGGAPGDSTFFLRAMIERGEVSTFYDGTGQPFPPPPAAPLVVTIPAALNSVEHGTPTGVFFNPTADFVVRMGSNFGSSFFIFATEDGTISGWNPQVNFTTAIRVVDNSATGAVYKGLALGDTAAGPRLYAANFRAGTIDEFDQNFAPVHVAGAFVDRHAPAGFAPFNVTNIGGLLYVTYAQQDTDKKDDVPGVGKGFINVFDPEGHLLRRFAQSGRLNSPWGMTLAPFSFGRFSNALLVGNFGDGHILAFDLNRGSFLGQLRDATGQPLAIEGLWGLAFGNGDVANRLFFTAGINDEKDGLFGSIQACQRNQGCL